MNNRYEPEGIIGEGAYGVVYKCKNKVTNEIVAIKRFREIEDDIVKKSMIREVKALKALKHENIVQFKEAIKKKNNIYLVCEFVDRNLLELLNQNPKGLNPNLIKKLIFQMCKAIKYLHENKMIHRDIKPENLLVDNSNKLKLCDFGFAIPFERNSKKIMTDYVATRWYRSPELLVTGGSYGEEVDYWAIGCIMGELADGDPMFPGDSEIHQISVIQDLLGELPSYLADSFKRNKHFSGSRLPEVVKKPQTLKKRYMGKLSNVAISFMEELLQMDPRLRLKGDKVFSHPYFEGLVEKPSSVRSSPNNKIVESVLKDVSPSKNVINVVQQKPVDKIVMNTTNINIYNLNKKKPKQKENMTASLTKTTTDFPYKQAMKSKYLAQPKLSSDNLISTSVNFSKKQLGLYQSGKLDTIKATYRSKKYNYNIDYTKKGAIYRGISEGNEHKRHKYAFKTRKSYDLEKKRSSPEYLGRQLKGTYKLPSIASKRSLKGYI